MICHADVVKRPERIRAANRYLNRGPAVRRGGSPHRGASSNLRRRTTPGGRVRDRWPGRPPTSAARPVGRVPVTTQRTRGAGAAARPAVAACRGSGDSRGRGAARPRPSGRPKRRGCSSSSTGGRNSPIGTRSPVQEPYPRTAPSGATRLEASAPPRTRARVIVGGAAVQGRRPKHGVRPPALEPVLAHRLGVANGASGSVQLERDLEKRVVGPLPGRRIRHAVAPIAPSPCSRTDGRPWPG